MGSLLTYWSMYYEFCVVLCSSTLHLVSLIACIADLFCLYARVQSFVFLLWTHLIWQRVFLNFGVRDGIVQCRTFFFIVFSYLQETGWAVQTQSVHFSPSWPLVWFTH